ncbi:bifunctional phosphoserine phosphatase/homoserine phosphotransferase ThrH [Candidatus Haliotispira prima]|uniref:Bifunctional phosphoserine phosphatase/homoserine phosphotransferase ThrH n=1 Tax=Candidatus Haliotispira prima TaxID=3034016 RepID=A0ABY8MJT9_9SPIO|nr:bifunctional phosphoserine phosphatase/homoserine phosphotransferase ThrH [Candidatus Haliotispira prima]
MPIQHRFPLFCLDLEGVLWPEMWQSVARLTNIEELGLTTQEIQSYDELMHIRLKALESSNVTLPQIQEIIESLEPLDGAKAFLAELRKLGQVVIISDTFVEFLRPVLRELNNPMVFCNALETDEKGFIKRHIMRSSIGKKGMLAALSSQGYSVGAAGDSYNDIGMLLEAQWGAFLFAPEHIVRQFPQIPDMHSYDDLLSYWRHSLH